MLFNMNFLYNIVEAKSTMIYNAYVNLSNKALTGV